MAESRTPCPFCHRGIGDCHAQVCPRWQRLWTPPSEIDRSPAAMFPARMGLTRADLPKRRRRKGPKPRGHRFVWPIDPRPATRRARFGDVVEMIESKIAALRKDEGSA